MTVFSDGLFLPFATLALLGWLVPKLLSLMMAEGVRPLLLLTLLATLILFAASAVLFLLLYLWQGVPLSEIAAPGLAANVIHFGRLGLSAAIIWAPIMLLSVAGLPRNWTKEVW